MDYLVVVIIFYCDVMVEFFVFGFCEKICNGVCLVGIDWFFWNDNFFIWLWGGDVGDNELFGVYVGKG